MNTLQNTGTALGDSMRDIFDIVAGFVPQLLLAIILVLIGFLFGNILGRAAAHLVNLAKLDKVLTATGIKAALDEANVHFSLSKTVGGFVKWVIVLCFLLAASEVVGLNVFSQFILGIIGYIPSVIAAALILVATFVLADFTSRLVRGSAKAVNMPAATAGVVTKYSIIFVGVVAALSQLSIASDVLEILFTGIIAALSLALGLAFGLGGKDTASRILNKVEENWK